MAATSSAIRDFLDSIAKSILDLETAFDTTLSSAASTIAAGQATLTGKVASLNDLGIEVKIGSAVQANTAAASALVAAAHASVYRIYAETLLDLDIALGGLNAYLVTNTLQVHPEFAAAFNAMCVGYGSNRGLTQIAPAHIFPEADKVLASIAVTGAAAGTFAAGTNLDLTKYAAQQLYLKNTAGSGTTGTATSFTITYTNAAGAAGQTSTQALGASLAAGAKLAINAIVGSAVSNIVVNSGGANGDAIAVVAGPLRSVAY